MAWLQSTRIQRSEMSQLIDLIEFQWAYIEHETQVELVAASETFNVLDYTFGKLFGTTGELRWTQNNDEVSVQWLCDAQHQLQEFELSKEFDTQPTKIYLWGTHQQFLEDRHHLRDVNQSAPIWIETRIPRPLRYPVTDIKPRVVVKGYHYLEQGLIRTTRWGNLEAHTDG